jgi:hypothetical protein
VLIRFGKWVFDITRYRYGDLHPEREKGITGGYCEGWRHGIYEGYFADPADPIGTVPHLELAVPECDCEPPTTA